MRKIKNLLCTVLVLMMVFSLAAPAFAADEMSETTAEETELVDLTGLDEAEPASGDTTENDDSDTTEATGPVYTGKKYPDKYGIPSDWVDADGNGWYFIGIDPDGNERWAMNGIIPEPGGLTYPTYEEEEEEDDTKVTGPVYTGTEDTDFTGATNVTAEPNVEPLSPEQIDQLRTLVTQLWLRWFELLKPVWANQAMISSAS